MMMTRRQLAYKVTGLINMLSSIEFLHALLPLTFNIIIPILHGRLTQLLAENRLKASKRINTRTEI